MPTVVTEMKDPDKNFTFRVLAYRKLTETEMRQAFAVWNQQRERRRSLKNQTVEVISSIE